MMDSKTCSDCANQFKRQRQQRKGMVNVPQVLLRSALVCLLLISFTVVSLASSSATAGSSSNKQPNRLGLPGALPDPFVAASPLIVAAVCSDGVAMVATHTVSSKENLLRDYRSDENRANDINDDDPEKERGDGKPTTAASGLKDIPRDHGGPYRIQKIDRCGTHLLSAGWRADCDLLTAKVRSIASRETSIFGPPKWGLPFGRHLAQETSLWMAQCAVSDAVSSTTSDTYMLHLFPRVMKEHQLNSSTVLYHLFLFLLFRLWATDASTELRRLVSRLRRPERGQSQWHRRILVVCRCIRCL